MIDIRSRSDIESAIDSQSLAASGVTVGETIDIKDYEALDYCINAEITAGDLTLAIYEGDESDMSDESAVANADLIGEAGLSVTGTGSQKIHVGYVGNKRYTRAKLQAIGASVDIVASGIAYKGKAKHSPTV